MRLNAASSHHQGGEEFCASEYHGGGLGTEKEKSAKRMCGVGGESRYLEDRMVLGDLQDHQVRGLDLGVGSGQEDGPAYFQQVVCGLLPAAPGSWSEGS